LPVLLLLPPPLLLLLAASAPISLAAQGGARYFYDGVLGNLSGGGVKCARAAADMGLLSLLLSLVLIASAPLPSAYAPGEWSVDE
jgi:hypothetical protein